MNAIDIFSGAGGMSIGAAMAGIKIDLAIDFYNSNISQPNMSDALNFRCVSGESPFHSFYHHRAENVVYTQGLSLMWQDTEEVVDFKANWVDALNYCENLDLS